MSLKTTVLSVIIFIGLISASAAYATSAPPAASPQPNAKLSEVNAALFACAGQVSKDANGMPDRQAMRDCMKGKGFTPPAGSPPPPGGGGNNTPPLPMGNGAGNAPPPPGAGGMNTGNPPPGNSGSARP